MSKNPLMQYFRKPEIYVKLPTLGRFNPEIELTSLSEVGVCAMTAIDELSLKNPDALLNGEALISTIQSCVPSIKNAKKLCNIDAEALFLAIQYATYGSEMTHTHTCKKCEESNEFSIDINFVLNKFPEITEVEPVKWEDLVIHIRPASLDSITRMSIIELEQKRIVNNVKAAQEDTDDARIIQTMYSSFRKIAELNVLLLANAIRYIETPDGNQVEDPNHLIEFLHNIPSTVVDEINKKAADISKKPKDLTKFEFVCPGCEHKDTVDLEVNPVNFFAGGYKPPQMKKS